MTKRNLKNLLDIATIGLASIFNKGSIFFITLAGSTLLNLHDFAKLTVVVGVLYTGINIFANAFQIAATTFRANQIESGSAHEFSMPLLPWAITFGAVSSIFLAGWIRFSTNDLSKFEYILCVSWGTLQLILACVLGNVQGLRRNSVLAKALVLNGTILLATTALLIKSLGSTGFLIALTASTIATLTLLRSENPFLLTRNLTFFSLKITKTTITRVALPTILAALVSLPSIWYPIHALQSSGFTLDLAIYGIALQVKNVATLIPVFFGGALLPWLAKRSSRTSASEADFLISYGVPFVIIYPLLTIPEITLSLFNNGFGASDASALEYMLATALIICYKTPIGRELIVSMRGKLSTYSNASWLAIYVIFLTLDCSQISANSFAKALLLSTAIHLLLWIPYYLKQRILQPYQIIGSFAMFSTSSVALHFLHSLTNATYLDQLSWLLYILACIALCVMISRKIKYNAKSSS